MDHIIFDCEIKNQVKDVPGGWDNPAGMGVSCAVVYESKTGRYRIFGDTEEELIRLQNRLCQADRIGGFNIRRFDIPLVFRQNRTWRHPEIDHKLDDILERIWLALHLNPNHFDPQTHGGLGLDAVAGATLSMSKIGYGGDAPVWYQAGQWYRVANYCCDDTALEKDLSDHIDVFGSIRNPLTGEGLPIPKWNARNK